MGKLLWVPWLEALWNTGTSETSPNERDDGRRRNEQRPGEFVEPHRPGRLTANGWESRHFESHKAFGGFSQSKWLERLEMLTFTDNDDSSAMSVFVPVFGAFS